jgi:hypothetical protein
VAGAAAATLASAAAGVHSIRRRQRAAGSDAQYDKAQLSEDVETETLQPGEAEPPSDGIPAERPDSATRLVFPLQLDMMAAAVGRPRSITLEEMRELLKENRRDVFRDSMKLSSSFFAAGVFVSVMVTLLLHPIGG